MRLNLDEVPRRTEGLTPYELMLSESQERMLAVCTADKLDRVSAILEKWDLHAHVVGEVTGELRRDDLFARHPASIGTFQGSFERGLDAAEVAFDS